MTLVGVALLVLGLDAPPAAPVGEKLEVEVGKTVEVEVGLVRGGWFCDDPAVVTAELVTRDDHNVWRVTGVRRGTTACRVGVEEQRAPRRFAVSVIAPKARAPR